MSYLFSVLNELPVGLWMMDDTAPFQDYSGYGRTGAMFSGTPTTAASLVAGTAYSTVLSNTNVARFATPVYQQGQEKQPFTLEVSLRVIAETGAANQRVLSSASNYDGIYVNGTIVTFSTKYLTAGECKVSYDIQTKRNVHVVGVHTADKNSLYIDGVMVGETEISEAQAVDSYVATDTYLYSGTSGGTQQVAVNGIAIYGTPLNDEMVKSHYNAARRIMLSEGVVPSFGGARFSVARNLSDTFVRATWTTETDWKLGVLSQAGVVNSRLVPQLENGTSVAGDWQSVLHLDCGQSSVYGVSMDWEGYGVTVQASLDGTNWETVQRGLKLTIIPAGFDPTDKTLQLKVVFPGGVYDDPAFMDNLTVVGFLTGKNADIDGRTITFTEPASPMNEYEPIEQRDDWGIRLSGGVLTLGAVVDNPVDIFTINIWMKRLGATMPTISVSGTQYKNGVAGSTFQTGEWMMYTIVSATPIAGAITINSSSGSAQIGQVELYDSQLSAAQVLELYKASVGIPILSVSEADVLTITNPNPSSKFYAYTWAITGAG